MPSVINGIGTWQYGKKNKTVRTGTCTLCGKSSTLESYDTREYVVVFFIPIIPLTRYHNIDHCSYCSKWKTMPFDKWEKLKEESLTKALDEFAATPGSYKAAFELYSNFVVFQKLSDAEKMLAHIRDVFPNEPEAMHLAGIEYWDLKRYPEAQECFERVLALDPANAYAPRNIIGVLNDAGKLDEALPKLKAILPSTNPHDTTIAKHVYKALRKAKRFQDVLDITRLVREGNPAIVKETEYRSFVTEAEKVLGKPSSLPPPPFSIFKSVVLPAAIVLVLVAIFGGNYYRSQHRTIHIVSGLPKPVTVQVDGVPYIVPASGTTVATVPEGTHHIKVLGEAADEYDIAIKSGYVERFTKSPAYIVDVAGSVALSYSTVVYSRLSSPPSTPTYHIGERFIVCSNVDHIFENPPSSLQVKGSNRELRTCLRRENATVEQLFGALANKSKFTEGYDLALSHLKCRPEAPISVLSSFVYFAKSCGKTEPALAFLKAECARRPIEVEWHRTYQTLAFEMGKGESILAEYDALLKASPNDSDVLYLRSRISDSLKTLVEYATKSIAANPANAHAHGSLSYAASVRADWAHALEESKLAIKSDPKNPLVIDRHFTARVTAGDLVALETELNALLVNAPDPRDVERMLVVLTAQKKVAELRQFVIRMRHKAILDKSNGRFWGDYQEELAAYLLGELKDYKKTPTSFHVPYLLETGQLDAAAASVDSHGADFSMYMVVALAFGRAKNLIKTDDYLRSAQGTLMIIDSGGAKMAEYLRGTYAPSIDEVLDVPLAPAEKALSLISLSDKFPENKTQYLELAMKLNAFPGFPSREIDRAIQERAKK